jgi:hypothetical protein
MRVGDFSELLTQSTPVVITDPANNNQPFVGNVIPSNRILTELPGYFDSYIPLPNRPGLFNNFVTSGRRLNAVDQAIGRIDHQISSKTTINGRYVYNRIYDLPFTTNPNFFESQGSLNNNVTLYISHSLSPNTIAYFRAGYNRFAQDLTSNTANTTPNITSDILNISGLSSDPRASGAPFLLPSNFSNLGGSFSQPREWFSERYEYQGGIYHVHGRHNIRGGFHAIRHHETFPEIFIPNGFNTYSGIFSGHSISDMLLGMPDSFSASPDLFDPQFRFWELMPWIQDDWRVTKNLTLNFGVRYERWGRPVSKYDDVANIRLPQGSNQAFIAVAAPCEVSALHGCQTTLPVQTAPTRSTINSDNNNFAPRIGFAYRVGGSDKTVLRGAYGVFYQREPINQFIFLSINPPFVSYYSAFYSQANIGTFDFYNPLANQPPGGLQFTLLSDDYRDAYLQQWNIGIQRDLGAGFVADLRYLGNKGTKIVARTWPNQPAPGPGAVDPRRPYTNVGLIAGNEPIGNSNYHSLQIKTEKRFSQGLSLLAAYTWSKAITDTQGAESGNWATAELQNSHDRRANRGLFSGDVRHRFTLSYVYELPIGKGKHFGSGASGVRDKLISGWQAGMIGSFQSGQPLSATLTFDNSNVGEGAKFPDLIGDPNTGPKTVEQFFNTSVFSVPAPLTFGNQGVGVITSPGINVFDLSIVKNTRFRERFNIQFRTEIFNLANHLIMADPNTSVGSPGFGGVFGTRMDSREIQFALRFEF